MDVGDGGSAVMGGGEACVGSGMVGERDYSGSLGLSESSGKTSDTVSNSFSSSFSMRVGAGVIDVMWVKRQRSMSLTSSLVLISRVLILIFCSNFGGCGRFLKE